MSARQLASRAIVRGFVGVLGTVALVLGSATTTAQEQPAPADSRPAEVRIRELADRGRTERGQGKIDASIETFELAQKVADGVGDYRSVTQLDSEIVNSLAQAGRFERGLEILHGIETRVEERQDDPKFVAAVRVHVRSDISQFLQKLGRTNEALEVAREAVDELETTQDPAARESALTALGNCLLWMNRPGEARAWLQRALEEAEKLDPSDPRPLKARIMLAQCMGELGDFESALRLADDLVNQLESLGSFPASLGSEAYALRGQLWFYKDWNAAEKDLRRSLDLLQAAGVEESRLPFQRTTLQLALAIRNTGRPEESAILERRALSVLSEHYPATDLTAIWASQFLAASLRDLYERTGDRKQLDESRSLLEEAARLSKEVGNPNASSVFTRLGELLLVPFDDPRAAEPWLRAAVDEIESGSSQGLLLDESERADFLQRRRFRSRFDPYESLLSCLVRLDRPDEALAVLEHSRARSLTDLLERSRFDSLGQALDCATKAGDAETADRIRELPKDIDGAMAALATARFLPEEEGRARVRQAHERIRRLETERAEITRSVTTAGTVASIIDIRRELQEGEILLAYFLGRKASFACLAEPAGGRIEWIPLLDEDGSALTADAIEALARAWIEALSRGIGDPARGLAASKTLPERETSMNLTGHRLFRWLAPPAIWERIRDRKIAHLVPHGPLNWMPFEALVVEPAGGDGAPVYWIDRGPAITYQESGSALVWAQRRRDEQKRAADQGLALIVADPDYRNAPEHSTRTAKGPIVVHVRRGGPAALEGWLVGDELESLEGTKVESVADYERIRSENQDSPGAPLVIVRSGVERALRLPPGDSGLVIASSLPSGLQRGSSRTSIEPLDRLPGTAREAHAVREALEKRTKITRRTGDSVRVLMGGEATETLLTAWAGSASILHIAAHQIPDPSGCSDSGRIALTAPPIATAEDDGCLDLDDLLIHWRGRLENCGLVVLSSCWSRTGRLVRDEGFFGLPFGLRFAGCPSIVSSLWPVDDAAAADLMSTFYGSIGSADAEDRLVAFQSSKRALKGAWPDPYYWAAFVWSGAPR
jgi:tetratricopeptide (TPR) repeat protein